MTIMSSVKKNLFIILILLILIAIAYYFYSTSYTENYIGEKFIKKVKKSFKRKK